MTVMSATSARWAKSSFVQPFSAMSSAMSWPRNRMTAGALLRSVAMRNRYYAPLVSSCNNKMHTVATIAKAHCYDADAVRERPVYFKQLGAYLTGLRTERAKTDDRWRKQTYAVKVARDRGLRSLTRQVLLRMERGQVRDPEADVLRAFAGLYGLPEAEIFGQFFREKYGIELPDPARGASQADTVRHGRQSLDPVTSPDNPSGITSPHAESQPGGSLGAEAVAVRSSVAALEIARQLHKHIRTIREDLGALSTLADQLVLQQRPASASRISPGRSRRDAGDPGIRKRSTGRGGK